MTVDPEFAKLRSMLSPFDPVDLMCSAAALQICPQNAATLLRLDVLTHIIASLPIEADKPRISIRKLRRICNEYLGKGQISLLEDPPEQAFTEAFTFTGGSYVVFPGVVSDSTHTIRQLDKAIFKSTEAFPDAQFAREAKYLFGALLAISNKVAEVAGLKRNLPPDAKSRKSVVIPANFPLLRDAVVFTNEAISNLLRSIGAPANILDAFITEFGSIDIDNYSFDNGVLHQRPLVRFGNAIIVSQPGVLLAALRHRVVLLSIERQIVSTLAERYRLAAWDTVVQLAGYYRYAGVPIQLPPQLEDFPAIDGLWFMDTCEPPGHRGLDSDRSDRHNIA